MNTRGKPDDGEDEVSDVSELRVLVGHIHCERRVRNIDYSGRTVYQHQPKSQGRIHRTCAQPEDQCRYIRGHRALQSARTVCPGPRQCNFSQYDAVPSCSRRSSRSPVRRPRRVHEPTRWSSQQRR